MFQRILVANRGEIALRVIRACKDMGIEVVAVYSEADRDAPYLALADQAICIGPANSAESRVFFMAMILNPASSIILVMAPEFPADTASGLIIVKVLFPILVCS